MKRLTQNAAENLRSVLERDGWRMETVEYPSLFKLRRAVGSNETLGYEEVVINLRGKSKASYWMKGKREEFGIPLAEFMTYSQWSHNIGIPLYVFIYEDISHVFSYINEKNVISRGRIWHGDDIDAGGSIFVPKHSMIPIAELDAGRNGETRYINRFEPKDAARKNEIEAV